MWRSPAQRRTARKREIEPHQRARVVQIKHHKRLWDEIWWAEKELWCQDWPYKEGKLLKEPTWLEFSKLQSHEHQQDWRCYSFLLTSNLIKLIVKRANIGYPNCQIHPNFKIHPYSQIHPYSKIHPNWKTQDGTRQFLIKEDGIMQSLWLYS